MSSAIAGSFIDTRANQRPRRGHFTERRHWASLFPASGSGATEPQDFSAAGRVATLTRNLPRGQRRLLAPGAPQLALVPRRHPSAPDSSVVSPTGTEVIRRQVHDDPETSTGVLTKEESVHSRTPVLLRFSLRLPSVEARGRWRERGRIVSGEGLDPIPRGQACAAGVRKDKTV